MEAMQIILADGRVTQSDKLSAYFEGIFAAEKSGEDFPVDLNHVWAISYSRKDSAVRALEGNPSFVQGVDYQVSHRIAENSDGGRPETVYQLSVSCLEYLTVKANRVVFEVYRKCRQAVANILRGNLPDFSDPAAAARAWAEQYEEKQKALAQAAQSAAALAEALPKVDFYNAVQVAANSLSFSEAAKWLKIPGVGRNKLIAMLKKDKVLMANREPYQRYVEEGYFEVEPQTYEAGAKGRQLTGTTRVTPRGLEWLAKKYKGEQRGSSL